MSECVFAFSMADRAKYVFILLQIIRRSIQLLNISIGTASGLINSHRVNLAKLFLFDRINDRV